MWGVIGGTLTWLFVVCCVLNGSAALGLGQGLFSDSDGHVYVKSESSMGWSSFSSDRSNWWVA